jgi:hypothetical protein
MCFCFFFSFAIWRGFVKVAACFQSFYKFCLLKFTGKPCVASAFLAGD